MKYINVRQLSRSLEESTKELPVIVTRGGIPIFTIIPMGVGLTPEGTVADLKGGKYTGEIEEYYPQKISNKISEVAPKLEFKEPIIKDAGTVVSMSSWAKDLDLQTPRVEDNGVPCFAPVSPKCKSMATVVVHFEDRDHLDHTLTVCKTHLAEIKKNVSEIFSETVL